MSLNLSSVAKKNCVPFRCGKWPILDYTYKHKSTLGPDVNEN